MTTTNPQTFVHKWPWRAEEFISMALVFGLAVVAGYLTHNILWLAVSVAVGVGLVILLYWTKVKRVNKSKVTVTVIGSTLRVESAGPLGKTQFDVTKTKSISYRKFGSDETFMISDKNNTVRVPVRATIYEPVKEAVIEAFHSATNISNEAKDLREHIGQPVK